MSLVLYDFPISANSYRVRLMMSLANLDYTRRPVNLATGEQRSPDFLAVNPLGQLPVLVDGDWTVRDSHAIVLYLAERYAPDWHPADPKTRAEINSWLFFDANDLHNGVGLARNFYVFKRGTDGVSHRDRGAAALGVLDAALAERDWLVGDKPSVADIACYPLTSVMSQATIDPRQFPAIEAWSDRLRDLRGFTEITA